VKAKAGSSPLDDVKPSATPSTERPVATQPAEIVTTARQNQVGALDRPQALRRFYDAIAKLEAGTATDDVRVTQFGDSHTAADIQTGAVRRALQTRFGDGGRGFVAIGRPWKQWSQDGVKVGMSTDWAPERPSAKTKGLPTDGLVGLSGIGLFTHSHGARAWADVTAKTSRAEIDYLEQPNGGAFDVIVDGVRVVRIATKSERTQSAFRSFDVAENSGHQLEVRAAGDGDVRVFGMSLDRTAQYGIVLDALGINGARVTTALSWNEQHWAEQLKHRSPALVILAYGTNESVDVEFPQATFERQLVDQLGRIARAVPGASCLLLGPPDRAIKNADGDWVTAPKILEIVNAEKRVAEAAGCAFYDQLAAMGGEGSIAQWANDEPRRAQPDRVHLTRDGYAQVGSSFASDLMRGYAVWRRESGLPPSTTKEQPLVASTLPPAPDVTEW
jgi:lysophospholipase L1-like esterase/type II secretory pathway pseudopilin PulG